jgi:hypothetical protein
MRPAIGYGTNTVNFHTTDSSLIWNPLLLYPCHCLRACVRVYIYIYICVCVCVCVGANTETFVPESQLYQKQSMHTKVYLNYSKICLYIRKDE